MVLKRVGSIFIGLGMLLMAFSYAPPTADAAFGNVSTFIGQISAGDGGQALNAYFDFPERETFISQIHLITPSARLRLTALSARLRAPVRLV